MMIVIEADGGGREEEEERERETERENEGREVRDDCTYRDRGPSDACE